MKHMGRLEEMRRTCKIVVHLILNGILLLFTTLFVAI
jgi:hypothetical protein